MIKKVKKMNDPITNEFSTYRIEWEGVSNTFTFVPLTEENRHYQEILEWVAEGNTIEEAD